MGGSFTGVGLPFGRPKTLAVGVLGAALGNRTPGRVGGRVPVRGTSPRTPRSDSATANQNAQIWNMWVTGFAQSRGYALLDLWAALVDPSTGQYKSGYSGDGVHPTPAGMKAIADYLAGTNLFNTLPAWSVQRPKTSTEATNAVSNAVMLNSSSGLASGWNSWGSPTFSIVAPQASDGIAGNWQQIAVAASGAEGGFQYNTATMASLGWNAGDIVAVTMRLQTTGLNSAGYTATNYLNASLSLPDASNVNQDSIVFGASRDVDGLVYLERPLRSDTYNLQVNVTWPSPTAAIQVRVAEVSVRNLTLNSPRR